MFSILLVIESLVARRIKFLIKIESAKLDYSACVWNASFSLSMKALLDLLCSRITFTVSLIRAVFSWMMALLTLPSSSRTEIWSLLT